MGGGLPWPDRGQPRHAAQVRRPATRPCHGRFLRSGAPRTGSPRRFVSMRPWRDRRRPGPTALPHGTRSLLRRCPTAGRHERPNGANRADMAKQAQRGRWNPLMLAHREKELRTSDDDPPGALGKRSRVRFAAAPAARRRRSSSLRHGAAGGPLPCPKSRTCALGRVGIFGRSSIARLGFGSESSVCPAAPATKARSACGSSGAGRFGIRIGTSSGQRQSAVTAPRRQRPGPGLELRRPVRSDSARTMPPGLA